MAIKVSKKIIVDTEFDIVKLQYMIHCFVNKMKLSNAELDVLTLLATHGISKDTIDLVVSRNIFDSAQTVRNCMTKLTKMGLLSKERPQRKVNTDIQIGIDKDCVLLNLNIGYINGAEKS
jgi:predicted transcriptional regulator